MGKSVHIKYLIANEQDKMWGLTVNSTGYQHIDNGQNYPPQNHPTRYLFSTDKGRVLEEYQLLYITRGSGKFVSANQKPIQIKSGNIILLFPGEWHNYKPDKETGWDEYWIGFDGANMDARVVNGFFSKNKPVFNVGIREDIVVAYKNAIDIARNQSTGFQQMLAGIVNYILGITYSQDKQASFEDLQVINHISKAKLIILENYMKGISPEEIASQINMSYSWFRRIFKQYTGFAPAQYILTLKIQKCKELLTNTGMTAQEIAYETGFDSPDYFSTIFKKKTGMTPICYREFTQGRNL